MTTKAYMPFYTGDWQKTTRLLNRTQRDMLITLTNYLWDNETPFTAKEAAILTEAKSKSEKEDLCELLNSHCMEVSEEMITSFMHTLMAEAKAKESETVTNFVEKTHDFFKKNTKKSEKFYIIRNVFFELFSFKNKHEKAKKRTAKATESRKKAKDAQDNDVERNVQRYDNVTSIVTFTNQNQNQNQNQKTNLSKDKSVSQRGTDRQTFINSLKGEEKSLYVDAETHVRNLAPTLLQPLQPILQRMITHTHSDVDHAHYRNISEVEVRRDCFQKALELALEKLATGEIDNIVAYIAKAFDNNWREYLPPLALTEFNDDDLDTFEMMHAHLQAG